MHQLVTDHYLGGGALLGGALLGEALVCHHTLVCETH
jgi:hypothetical protein